MYKITTRALCPETGSMLVVNMPWIPKRDETKIFYAASDKPRRAFCLGRGCTKQCTGKIEVSTDGLITVLSRRVKGTQPPTEDEIIHPDVLREFRDRGLI